MRVECSIFTEEIFWANVHKSDGCWRWAKARRADGYGALRVKGKTIRAHRMAYVLAYGTIPDGLEVCHKCDNPACVRPDHLFLGTHSDNQKDMSEKGRAPRGERQGRHKLTFQQVTDIRAKYQLGKISQRELGRQYNVGSTAIRWIVKNWAWKEKLPLEFASV